MVQPGFEAPDDESWGGISRPSPAMSITRGPKPAAGQAMWAVPKRASADRVLLCIHGGG